MTLLTVNGIKKSFGGLKALNDVNLNVEEGTVHAVIGPNGAGKSTLLHTFVGKLKPDEGAILFNGDAVPGQGSDADQPTGHKPGVSNARDLFRAVDAGKRHDSGFG